MMKKTIAAIAILAATSSAAMANGWSNIYADYYNHMGRSSDNGESVVLGIEGGSIGKYHDMYGFYEVDKTAESTFGKVSNHWKVLPNDFSIYTQATDFQNNFGGETTATVGLGYSNLTGSNWAFKPYVGYTTKGGSFAGEDGVTVGWSGFYAVNSDLSITNWTDVELKEHIRDYTVNGGLGVWYDISKDFYTGVQYTYSYQTAGETGYGDSVGVRIGYHF